jgi:hypothetical protein
VNSVTNELMMRLRNSSDEDRKVSWTDEDSAQEGKIDAGAATDTYFGVQDGICRTRSSRRRAANASPPKASRGRARARSKSARPSAATALPRAGSGA